MPPGPPGSTSPNTLLDYIQKRLQIVQRSLATMADPFISALNKMLGPVDSGVPMACLQLWFLLKGLVSVV